MASHSLVLTDEMLAAIAAAGIDVSAKPAPVEVPKVTQSVKTKAGKPVVTHTAPVAAVASTVSDASKAYKALVPKVHKLIDKMAAEDGKSTGVPSFKGFGMNLGILAGLIPDGFDEMDRSEKTAIWDAISKLEKTMESRGDLVISPRKGYVMFFKPGTQGERKSATSATSAMDRLKALGLL